MDVPRVGEIYEIETALYVVREVDIDNEQVRLEVADDVAGDAPPPSKTFPFKEWREADFSLR